MKELILKLNQTNEYQESFEGVKIRKIVSSISPSNFIKLLYFADNKVNPRTATVNNITKSIYETLDKSPELFWYKSKGILLSTESCEQLDRNRVRLSFDNVDYEGIMDGGHNTFAIARFLIDKLFNKSLKTWDSCKDFWYSNYDEIVSRFEEKKDLFKFSVPIEIITPTDEDGAINDFYDYLSEICSARNNNVQLKETAKGNQVGYYDYLKSVLSNHDVIWKTGNIGKIKSEDVISLACLPLIFLKEKGLLPTDNIRGLNKISIYSQKSKCIEFFNDIMGHEDISVEDKGKYILVDNKVKTALSLTDDIIKLFDQLYIKFPELYHKATPGKFGRITAVEKKSSKVPFLTTEEISDYKYPYGYFYPLLCGITQLMGYDEEKNEVFWKIAPQELDLLSLNLEQYIGLIKILNFDPTKVGKASVCYNEAENVFNKIL